MPNSYTLVHAPSGKLLAVTRAADGASIPLTPGNRDYQEFLNWNARQAAPLSLADRAPDVPDPKVSARQQLADSDAGMSRVLEDVISALGIEASLPAASRGKLAARRALREVLK
jgi:hypothetical protein